MLLLLIDGEIYRWCIAVIIYMLLLLLFALLLLSVFCYYCKAPLLILTSNLSVYFWHYSCSSILLLLPLLFLPSTVHSYCFFAAAIVYVPDANKIVVIVADVTVK